MLPITPKGVRRYIRYNATRKGLFGGDRKWLVLGGIGLVAFAPVAAFFVFFLVVAACAFLLWKLQKKVRRLRKSKGHDPA